MSPTHPYGHTRDLVAKHLAGGDPTTWFDDLYLQAAEGRALGPGGAVGVGTRMAGGPGRRRHGLQRRGRGCGFGRDAELTARPGYRTTRFDVEPTAIEGTRARHEGPAITYEVGDLLDLPNAWFGTFDLVIESMNIQALPPGLSTRGLERIPDASNPTLSRCRAEFVRP